MTKSGMAYPPTPTEMRYHMRRLAKKFYTTNVEFAAMWLLEKWATTRIREWRRQPSDWPQIDVREIVVSIAGKASVSETGLRRSFTEIPQVANFVQGLLQLEKLHLVQIMHTVEHEGLRTEQRVALVWATPKFISVLRALP